MTEPAVAIEEGSKIGADKGDQDCGSYYLDTGMQVAKTALIDLAKRQIGTLRAELKYQASHQKSNSIDLEAAYQKLLRIIADSRLSLLQLSTYLEKIGDDPTSCQEVNSLLAVLHEAALLESKLYDDKLFPHSKKRSLKAFEESVLSVIKEGKGPYYFKTVTKEELLNQGQEINRLYQMLVEGKTAANMMLVDAGTLKSAAARTDLFSANQCAHLGERSKEVEALMLKETQRLVTFLRKDDYNKFTREFQDLFSAQIQQPNSQAAPAPATGWTCTKCTFENEKSSIVHCGGCGSPQGLNFATVAKSNSGKFNNLRKFEVVKSGVNPKANPNKKTVWILKNDVPELIGPRGKNVDQLKHQTGAKSIFAYQDHADSDGRCPVQIEGSPSAIRAAIAAIEQKFPSVRKAPKEATQSGQNQRVELYIDNAVVPALIGQNGKRIQKLIQMTGTTTIYAHQTRLDQLNRCPIEITGSPEAIQKAVAIIEKQSPTKSIGEQQVIWIPNCDVSEFIGPGGMNVKALKKKAGIEYVSAEQKSAVDGMCPIRIEGSISAVKEAVAIVLSKFDGTLDDPWRAAEEVEDAKSSGTPSDNNKVPGEVSSQEFSQYSKQTASSFAKSPPEDTGTTASLPTMDRDCALVTPNSRANTPSNQLTNDGMVGSGSLSVTTSTLSDDPAPSSRQTPTFIPLGRAATTNDCFLPGVAMSTAIDAFTKPMALPDSSSSAGDLHAFLRENESSLKCSAEAFQKWLQSEGIENLSDFAEALTDDDFVKEEMQQNGFKGYKRRAFMRAIEAKKMNSSTDSVAPETRASLPVAAPPHPTGGVLAPQPLVVQPPPELVCPIGQVLFHDPVLACDGHCYEREEIENWFRKANLQGIRISSPITGAPLEDSTLTPNLTIRYMAHEFKQNHPNVF